MTDQISTNPPEPTTPAPAANTLSKKLVIAAICLLIPTGVLAYAFMQGGSHQANGAGVTNMPATTNHPMASSGGSAFTATNFTFKDGTYSATGHYSSPGGAETIEVSLTLKDGIITDANVVSDAFRPMSMRMQGMFVDSYKPLVVGKSLNEVNLSKVSGSSLTPRGFNDAVAQIKTEAKA